jgi:hypothetical protein
MKALHVSGSQLSRYEFCQRAQEVFNDIVFELIRQVAVQSAERAKLLATVWVRSSEMMNSLTKIFVAEHTRHEQEEAQLREELRKSRKDYLLVVERLEEVIREQHECQSALLVEADERESGLSDQIDKLKNDLHSMMLKLRSMEDEKRNAALPPARQPPQLDGESNYFGNDFTDHEDPRVTIAYLRAELQRQRVLMLEAAGESSKLKESGPRRANIAVTAFPETRDVGSDPVEELISESSDDEVDRSSSAQTLKSSSREKPRKRK